MTTDPQFRETLSFIKKVAQSYVSLMRSARTGEDNLGGRLFYVGELNGDGRAFLVAANIAGSASLAATADIPAQKQAIRDGLADFLVTNLDEALRILKNEIRKREPVSVAVSIAPALIEAEMLDRGVLPELLPPQSHLASSTHAETSFIAQGAQPIAAPSSADNLMVWQIPAEYAQRPAAFDAILQEHIPQADHIAQRWLRLSPRYLGPQTRRLRSLPCDEETKSKLIALLGSPLQP